MEKEFIHIRVSSEDKKKAEVAAKKENRSLTNYITQLIRDDYLKKHQED